MKQIATEIEIEAPPERVWQVLTDFPRYPEWNPFLNPVRGEAREGAMLNIRAGSMRFSPLVERLEPNRELRWLGRLLRPGLFDGRHSFEIEPAGAGRVRFRQSERFTGVLVPLIFAVMGASTRRGFEAMNQALKQRAEAK